MVNFLKSLLELARSYLLRRKSGYSIAAILVLAYLGLQGIKLVSPWIDFELTLLGVDSGFGAENPYSPDRIQGSLATARARL
jgi:hypothetical protein